MFSLITYETSRPHQTAHCANHDRKMFILSVIESNSKGSLDLSLAYAYFVK